MFSNIPKFPMAYLDGIAYFLEPTDEYSGTRFGGPPHETFNGLRPGQCPLHHVLTIAAREVPPLGLSGESRVPFFYGMRYEGCRLSYRLDRYSNCKLLNLEPPRPTPDWPYPDYPPFLQYIPLRLARRRPSTSEAFAKFVCQPITIKRKTLTVIVPPLFVGGVSMWGPEGDGEGVQIIFEYGLESRTVEAFNRCT